MHTMEKDLQAIIKNLKLLTKKTEKLAKDLAKTEKKKVVRRPKKKAVARGRVAKKPAGRGAKKVTAIDSVMKVISSTKRGVNTTTIKARNGFDEKKIWNIINRLKQQRRIKSARKGVYVKI